MRISHGCNRPNMTSKYPIALKNQQQDESSIFYLIVNKFIPAGIIMLNCFSPCSVAQVTNSLSLKTA